MTTQIALDWFYLNSTELRQQYGPWPLWDVLTNYTTQRQLREMNTSATQDESPATFGFATGALLILALTSRSRFQLEGFKFGLSLNFSKKFVYQLLITTIILMLVPIFVMFMMALLIYKTIAAIFLKRKLLCGADAVWALDATDSNSKAIVNVLVILEEDINLEQLKNVVQQKLIPASKKLSLYRAYSSLGYFYWDDKKKGHEELLERVRYLEGCKEEEEEMTEDELRAKVSSTCNAPLPENDSAGWEILLGPRLAPESGHADTSRRALIFRVHHSMGDGPALCRVFISAIADPQPDLVASQSEAILKSIARKSQNNSTLLDKIYDGLSGMLGQASMQPDSNLLHGPLLSGRKQVAWRKSEALLHATQRVRKVTGAPFSAVLLAGLTSAVADHLQQRGAEIKNTSFSVVIPVRLPGQFTNPSDQAELDNAFSMTLVRTILSSTTASALNRVRSAEEALKRASNPATLFANSWAVQLVGGLLPRPLATVALYGGQCTSVLSNMPGPTQSVSLAGRTISQLTFWVPHRTNTGVGASVLSYAGQLTLGLMVDDALLEKDEDAHQLAIAWERHILQLEATLCAEQK